MKLKDIQTLKTALEKISSKSSILVKFKIELFLLTLQNELSTYEKLFKELVTEEVQEFEKKRMEIADKKLSNMESLILFEQMVEENKEMHKNYLTAVETINQLNDIDVSISFKLDFDCIPDDISDLSQTESDLIFSITD